MKYYSEILKKLFDTEDELKTAEHEKFIKEEKLKEEKHKKELEKEELRGAIEESRNALSECKERYEKAREEAARILEESNEKVEKVLNDAEIPLKNARKVFQDAVTDYTKKYGPYKVTYTGKEAEEKKDSVIKDLFTFPGWFW